MNPTNNGAKSAQSKILVLGGTGGTGRLIVGQALERGQPESGPAIAPSTAVSSLTK
ncbi:hypothetical protein [Bradyrhizobium sp. AUGA SZCCT0160]|uniref:hypothetical protein n=1 Tax=Bradyrhizobium sp. AUGA SZCCT0160 TaxID=2807662 RepID=UPI001BAB0404|nr:hypothetical protein [Bradyrhizobium sp. AUGA SZCCT0160]MBR1194063.1 hypothetical protein [Bradyrhizobium sp. AUGA SZCCT0160]